MTDRDTEAARRRRLINLGELIALAALVVSALGVWVSWKSASAGQDRPAEAVEQHKPVPLVLRGKRQDDGRQLEISPVEPAQAIESLRIALPGAAPIEVGSDGLLSASDVQAALKGHDDEPKDRRLSVTAQIEARYVEAGKDRKASASYRLQYMWQGGGLFGGRSLHLLGLAR